MYLGESGNLGFDGVEGMLLISSASGGDRSGLNGAGRGFRGVLGFVDVPPVEKSAEALRVKRIESLSGSRRRFGEVCLMFVDRLRPGDGGTGPDEPGTALFSWSSCPLPSWFPCLLGDKMRSVMTGL